MSTAEQGEPVLPGDVILRRRFRTPDIPVASSLSQDIVHFIESLDFFFIATSNRAGECDSSYRRKGEGALQSAC